MPASDEGTWENLPEVKTLVQSFIDRGGYSEGNYIGLRLTNEEPGNFYDMFYSYDNASGDAPKLHIEYTAGAPSFIPKVIIIG